MHKSRDSGILTANTPFYGGQKSTPNAHILGSENDFGSRYELISFSFDVQRFHEIMSRYSNFSKPSSYEAKTKGVSFVYIRKFVMHDLKFNSSKSLRRWMFQIWTGKHLARLLGLEKLSINRCSSGKTFLFPRNLRDEPNELNRLNSILNYFREGGILKGKGVRGVQCRRLKVFFEVS